jgi:uncharacterized protein (TIGR00369 family)
MSDPSLVEQMQAAFDSAPIHSFVGMRVLGDGRSGPAVVEIPLAANALGTGGQVHGGVISLLCDVACAIAASGASTYDHTTHALVTADLHVRYLAAARSGPVRVEAGVVKAGRTLIVVGGEVRDGDDRLLATADFSAMLVPFRQPLDPSP